ncbi:MAG TPA: hypothetical protein VNX40_03165 [Mucilaginibacter sp.]|jgi:hypothetical protein|nr:hypothetical protein [Mucilaginibacter sp.]
MDDEIEEFLKEHEICYDRFTFDKIFRYLLKNDYDHEEAKDVILYNCCLSVLVLQERIHNRYYYKIKAEDETSKDLLALKNKLAKDYLNNILTDLINK